jgi:uncharacterized protein (TIGR03067 family)
VKYKSDDAAAPAAIYTIEGDTLKWCQSYGGAARPTKFGTTNGDGCNYAVLKRVKKTEAVASGEEQSAPPAPAKVGLIDDTINPLHRIRCAEGIGAVEISPDGRYIVAVRQKAKCDGIRVWDTHSGKLIFERMEGWIARFTPDSTQLITCEKFSDLQVYDLATGRQVREFDTNLQMYYVWPAATGTRLLYGSPQYLQVWDWAAGKKLCQMLHDWETDRMFLTPDGQHLIYQTDGKAPLRVLDASTGEEVDAYKQLRDVPKVVGFSGDGKRLMCDAGGKLKEYDVASGKEIETHYYSGPETWRTISGDGRRLLGNGDPRDELRLLDATTGKFLKRLHFPESIELSNVTARLSNDGRYAVVSGPIDSIYVFRLPEPAPEQAREVLRVHWTGPQAWGIALSADGRYALMGAGDNRLRVWDTSSGEIRNELIGGQGVFLPDGRILTASGNSLRGENRFRLYAAGSGQLLRKFEPHPPELTNLWLAPDGKSILSVCTDQVLRLWDAETGKELQSWPGIKNPGYLYSPDSKSLLLRLNTESKWIAWDVTTGKETDAFAAVTGLWELGAILPGRREVVEAAGGAILIRAVDTGKVVRRLELPPDEKIWPGRNLCSPDGRLFATVRRDTTILVRSLETGKEVARLALPDGMSASYLCFSADNRSIAVANPKGQMHVWRLSEPPPSEKVGEVQPKRGSWGGGSASFDYETPKGQISYDIAYSTFNGRVYLVLCADDCAGIPSRGGPPAWGELRASDGREVAWSCLTRDGTSGTFTIDGKKYELENGAVFLVSFRGGRTTVQQVAVDMAKLQGGQGDAQIAGVYLRPPVEKGLKEVAKSNQELAGFLKGRATLHSSPPEKVGDVRRFPWNDSGQIFTAETSPDGRYLLAGAEAGVRLWDAQTEKLVHEFKGRMARFTPDGKQVLTGTWQHAFTDDKPSHFRLYDVKTGTELRSFGSDAGELWGFRISPDGKRAFSTTGEKTIHLWDLATGKELHRFEAASYLCGGLFTPDNNSFLLTLDNQEYCLFDLVSGKKMGEVKAFSGKSGLERFLDSGRLVLGWDDRTLQVYDVVSGTLVWKLKLHPLLKWISDSVSPDGRLLVATEAMNNTLHILDVTTGKELDSFHVGENDLKPAVFSADGRFAIVSSPGEIRLIRHRAFSPAGKLGEEGKIDMQTLQGDWVFSKAEIGTKEDKDYQGAKLAIAGNRLLIGPEKKLLWTFKLAASKKPKAIDLYQGDKLMTWGIYELEDDTLKLCYGAVEESGGGGAAPLQQPLNQPANFDSRQGGLFVLRRVKPNSGLAEPKREGEAKGKLVTGDYVRLQGAWTEVSTTFSDGKSMAVSKEKLVIIGDQFVDQFDGKEHRSAFKLNPDTNPKQIDMYRRGKLFARGIYELNRDELKVLYGAVLNVHGDKTIEYRPQERPASFTVKGLSLTVYKRERISDSPLPTPPPREIIKPLEPKGNGAASPPKAAPTLRHGGVHSSAGAALKAISKWHTPISTEERSTSAS